MLLVNVKRPARELNSPIGKTPDQNNLSTIQGMIFEVPGVFSNLSINWVIEEMDCVQDVAADNVTFKNYRIISNSSILQ